MFPNEFLEEDSPDSPGISQEITASVDTIIVGLVPGTLDRWFAYRESVPETVFEGTSAQDAKVKLLTAEAEGSGK